MDALEAYLNREGRANALLDLALVHHRRLAGAATRSASAITLVDHLFERPAVTVGDAQAVLGVTYAAARKTIDRLIELNILEEYPGSYPAVFLARGVLDAALPSD